jgi:hypothetical protein
VTLTFLPAKDAFGYVIPQAAWERLCAPGPPLPTEEFDPQFFPPDQASQRTNKDGRVCQVRAKVTNTGPAVWMPSDGPCNRILKSGDSYRRHVVLCHLGCQRGNETKLAMWICE